MKPTKHVRSVALVAGVLAVIAAVALPVSAGAAKAHTQKITLTVAYSQSYAYFTPQLSKATWDSIIKQFETQHPNVVVKEVPMPGVMTDIVTKISLLLRDPSTAPDVLELPTPNVGLWQSSGYLLNLSPYLKNSAWFKTFPKDIANEAAVNGQIYAVNHGENDNAIWYNMKILKKAGISVPWHPKTWADLITAAKAVKAKVPGVAPLFLIGGNTTGAAGLETSPLNFLIGSDTPYFQSPKNGKWIVDSPGLREVFKFYHDVSAGGLNAPNSQTLSAAATGIPSVQIPKGTEAIVPFGNYNGGQWNKVVRLPYWPQASKIEAVTPIPTIHGQGSDIASVADGWDVGIYSKTKHAKLAWELVNLSEQPANEALIANNGGYVPPDPAVGNNPTYLNWAPPYQKIFANILPHSTVTLTTADFTKWTVGFGDATALLLQNPKATVQDAINMMKQTDTALLGSTKVTTIP